MILIFNKSNVKKLNQTLTKSNRRIKHPPLANTPNLENSFITRAFFTSITFEKAKKLGELFYFCSLVVDYFFLFI